MLARTWLGLMFDVMSMSTKKQSRTWSMANYEQLHDGPELALGNLQDESCRQCSCSGMIDDKGEEEG
jgi:hypothetical protein